MSLTVSATHVATDLTTEPLDPELGPDLRHRLHRDRAAIAGLQERCRADREIIAVLEQQLAAARAEADHLRTALDSNRRIGAAIGVLMASRGLDEATAFDALRAASQNSNCKLRDVADDVLYTGVLSA